MKKNENFPKKPLLNKPENDSLAAGALIGGDETLNDIGSQTGNSSKEEVKNLIRYTTEVLSLKVSPEGDSLVEFRKGISLLEIRISQLVLLEIDRKKLVESIEKITLNYFEAFVQQWVEDRLPLSIEIGTELLIKLGIPKEKLEEIIRRIERKRPRWGNF